MLPINLRNLFSGAAAGHAALVMAGLVLVFLSIPEDREETGRTNLYVHQAQAFLDGHLDIRVTEVSSLHDLLEHEGRRHVVFPPTPALLLVPFVAVFGAAHLKVTLVSILLSVLNAWVLRRTLLELGTDRVVTAWTMAAFFFGTGYWFCVMSSAQVWYFAHVVAVTFLLLAIREALGRGRGYLTGLFLGLAALSRQIAGFAGLFLVVALWLNARHDAPRKRVAAVAGFACVLGLVVAGYLALNFARFGHPFDTGYGRLDLQAWSKERVEVFGQFHPAYLLYNFWYMFLEGPSFQWSGTCLLTLQGMSKFGTSLTFASPFVFLAFLARGNRYLLAAAWLSVLVSLGVILLYYNNGFVQLNCQRTALDFAPVLMLLVALGAPRCDPRVFRGLIVYAIVLNTLGLVVTPMIRACPK